MSDQVAIEVIEAPAVTVEVVQDGGVQVVEITAPSAVEVVEVIHPGPQGITGDPGAPGPPKAITIAQPKLGDQFTLFYTQQPTTLTQVLAIVRGDTPSVTFELRYGADRSTAGTLAIVPETITNTTTGEPVTVQNMPIPADQFLWIVITAVSGQVEELNVCVEL